MRVCVTGGAGFIGSHIVGHLIARGDDVVVYDNFSTGREKFIEHYLDSGMEIIRGDILHESKIIEALADVEMVFHCAANADVRGGRENRFVDLEQNTIGTYKILEAMKKCGIKCIVFASSATVYGEPEIFPTPEMNPLVQTSLYGASKLAAEALIQAYCEYFEMQSYIFRFVSWIGERYTHGVIFDFVKKLLNNPKELEILGNGYQRKSYLYVKDGVKGIFLAIDKFHESKNIFNLGHTSWINVNAVAKVVCEEMNLGNVKFIYTGGERGWVGDSPFVHLDISRLSQVGWILQTDIETGIRKTVQYLLANLELVHLRV